MQYITKWFLLFSLMNSKMLNILKYGIKNRSFSNNLIKVSKKYLKTNSSENLTESTIKYLEENVKKLRIYDEIDLLPADLDWSYLLNEENLLEIEKNNQKRKGNGDIRNLVS
jgi:hypothetical protein